MQKSIFWLLAPMLAIPSLYPLSQSVSTPITLIALLLTTLFAHTVLFSKVAEPFLKTPWPSSLLVILLSLATTIFHQPIPTFLPTAWNLLIRPLCEIGLLHLLTPLTLIYTIWTLKNTAHSWIQINRFSLILFSCLLMWPDGAADLPAIGLLILNLILMLTRQRIQNPELAACILLLAIVSSSRAILIYVPLLIGFSLLAVWPKRAAIVTLSTYALLIALKPSLPLITMSNLTDASFLAATILIMIIIIQSVYHWRWWPAHQQAAWGLGAPMLVVALSNLAETSSLANWYGVIYFMTALPVITYSLLRPTFKYR